MSHLTQEQVDRLTAHLNEKSPEHKCPTCGASEWGINGMVQLVMVPPDTDKIHFGGPYIPAATLTCQSCGRVEIYNLLTAGAIKPDPPAEDRPRTPSRDAVDLQLYKIERAHGDSPVTLWIGGLWMGVLLSGVLWRVFQAMGFPLAPGHEDVMPFTLMAIGGLASVLAAFHVIPAWGRTRRAIKAAREALLGSDAESRPSASDPASPAKPTTPATPASPAAPVEGLERVDDAGDERVADDVSGL